MASSSGPNPKILAGIVGLLALSLVAIPIMIPSDPVPNATQPVSESSLDPDQSATGTPESAAPSVGDDSSSPVEVGNDDAAANAAAEATIFSALAAYESQLSGAGGVYGSFISANSQEMMISLLPNGDFRAVTTDPNAPEWLYVDPVLYARLGPAELEAQKKALEAIGKPDAVWTDAAMNSETQGMYLSAANIANAVADLVPLMKRIEISEGPDATTIVQGTVDLTGDLGLNAEAYNLNPADATDAGAPTKASVVFTIDKSGVLQGYIVQPPGSAQPVSLLLTRFAAPSIKRPSPPRVITLEDLAPIVDDSTTSPSPSPTSSAP